MSRAGGKRGVAGHAVLAFLLLAAALRAEPDDELCAQCHADVTASYKETIHNQASQGSCSSCHGGSAAHLSAPARDNIFNPARAEPTQGDASCLRCHSSLAPGGRWKNNHHVRAGLGCISCHQIHAIRPTRAAAGPRSRALLREPTEAETCYGCHGAVRRAQLQRSTHLLPDDQRGARMACSECHDVHGSTGDKMLRHSRVNALCISCHDEKRGPFLWEHGPVRDNCLTCHAAHGSNNTHLLTMRVPMLCQSCHAGDAHTILAPSSSSAWLANRACVNCHQMVHGSNHPSGVTLQR